MAVKLRLVRIGKKKQPSYRLVAADSRSPRNGRFIEILGTYNPRAEPSEVAVDNDKALAWLRNGATPTETARKVLKISGAWESFTGEAPPAPPPPKPAKKPAPVPTAEVEEAPEPAAEVEGPTPEEPAAAAEVAADDVVADDAGVVADDAGVVADEPAGEHTEAEPTDEVAETESSEAEETA